MLTQTALGNALTIDQSMRPPLHVVSHTRPALSESRVFHWFYKVFLMYDSKHRKASFAQRDHMIVKEHVRNCCGSGKDSENGMTQPYPYFGSILEHGPSKSYVFHWFYKVFRCVPGHIENIRLRNVFAWF